jgi:uncharacterized protein
MSATNPALLAEVLTVTIEHEPYPSEQVRAGAPTSGWLPLVELDGTEIGVWEMTPGEASDTEADEVFCILAGRGRIDFIDPAAAPIELRPGVLVRLQAGWQTSWTVTETVRKIAVVPGEEPTS